MAGPGFYKLAFWVLLTVVAVVQIVITVVAHQRHDDAHHSLLPDGRGPLYALNNNVPGKAKRSPSYHSDSKSNVGTSNPASKKAWQEVLSSSPKIVLVHNFATKEE
jgi:hypothetical protein